MLLSLSTIALALTAVSAIPTKQTQSPVMRRLMGLKEARHSQMQSMGLFDADRTTSMKAGEVFECINGKAGEYSCENVNLHGYVKHKDMGTSKSNGNDIWGWTSPDGREFALVGQTDGTGLLEVMSDGSLKRLGRIPTATGSAIWRDIKVIDHHAYISSESRGHGIQIFDLNKLLTIGDKAPVVINLTTDVRNYTAFGNNHNVVANAETKFIYAVGSGTCSGGPHIINVADPDKPVGAGCVGLDGYTHDAQCVVYRGPDKRYTGKEVCFLYNEDTLTIVDVTDKAASGKPVGKLLSKTPYEGSGYTHQGWLLDDDHSMLLADDELDEMDKTSTGKSGHTVTYLWDVSDLTKPVVKDLYRSPAMAIDHNQYTVTKADGSTWVYQSNYQSGLRVVDVSSAKTNMNAKAFKQVAFFDCHPEDDAQGGEVEFGGSWSVYPWFKSGYILLNSIERGAYSLKLTV